ncbi:amino acid permease [Robbsia andropogonis]|uniref:amino acid permease n=2 Tax=Robbsia andropogonis TaxID=28092 RepID=UPI002646A1CA|nr:amino acid permease [Robbsia andropogonis]
MYFLSQLLRTKPVGEALGHQHPNNAARPCLQRSLGALDLVMLGIGAIVGTGIFVLTGTGAMMAGPGLSLSFIVAALACGLAALSYAEFASSIPVAGSIYTYTYIAIGELAAWLMGWILALEYGLAVSAVSIGWSGYFQSLLSGFGISVPIALQAAPGSIPGVATLFNLPAFLVVMLITSLLAIGIHSTSKVNNVMVAIKIGVVLLVIGVGAFHVRPENWRPFLPMGISGVFQAAAIMFFAYIGFDAVSGASEEVKNPKRDLPIGIIGSLLVCTILYIGVTTVLTGITPWQNFAGIAHPVSLSFQQIGVNWMAGCIDLAAVVGMLTVMLVMAYGQTRLLFAMSRDGLLPPALSTVHHRFKTPYLATWLVGLVFGLIGALVPLQKLAELVNFGTLSAFAMVSVSVIVMRHTHKDLHRGFRCPGVPWIPGVSIVMCLFLLMQLQTLTWIAFAIWVLAGLFVYFGYARKRAHIGRR